MTDDSASTDNENEFDLVVTLRGPYYLNQMKRLLADLGPILDLDGPAVVKIDMRNLTFIGPAALATTAAVLRQAREIGTLAGGSAIVSPRRPGTRNYIHRMDFLQVLFEHETTEIESEVVKHESPGLKECQHFETEQAGKEIARGLAKALKEKVSTDSGADISLRLCLEELADNVRYHAETPHGGFAAAQAMSHSKEIEIAIVDTGIGIAESLASNPEHEDVADDEIAAINEAVKTLVTAKPESNRGYGLAFTRFLMEMNSGRLIVWSGRGRVQFGESHTETETDIPFPGTLVALRVHTDRPFDFEKAYEQLTLAINEIEGDFDDDVRVLPNATS